MLVFFLFSNSYFNLLLFGLFLCYQGIPEEELLRQQQELFQQARLQQAQVLDYFCDGLALDNVESRNTSSCFMIQQPEISISLVDHLACTAVLLALCQPSRLIKKLLVSGGGVATYSCGITDVGSPQAISGQSVMYHGVLCISYIAVTSTCVLLVT